MQSNEEYLLLLSKRLSGEISQEESAQLDAWLQQSPQNAQFAAQMQSIWQKTEGYGHWFSPNLDADFQKIQARIRPAAKAEFTLTFGQRLMRAAAVVALLLTAAWAWNQFATPVATDTYVSATQTGEQGRMLPDGSRIWLREGSQLTFSEKNMRHERRVKLQGEGYFEVEHDPAHPFKVELENGGSVEVLGTQFDICQSSAQTSVLVRSGKVRFSPTPGSEGPVLIANQKAVFDHSAAEIRVSTLPSLNELSWQTGGLEFVNTPLRYVVRDLEQFYKVKITLRNPAVQDCPHSAPLTRQPVDKVLATLALTHQLRVKKLGEKEYELSGGVCQ